jgi:hypothetical protein
MTSNAFYKDIRVDSTGIHKYYCNGEWLESSSGKSVPVLNPTTQEKEFAVQGTGLHNALAACNCPSQSCQQQLQ